MWPKSKILGTTNKGPMSSRVLHSTKKIGSLDCAFKYKRWKQPSFFNVTCAFFQSDPGPVALLQIQPGLPALWKIWWFIVGSALQRPHRSGTLRIHTQHILNNCAGVGGNGNILKMSQKPISDFLSIQRHGPITNTYQLSLLSTLNSSGRTLPLSCTWLDILIQANLSMQLFGNTKLVTLKLSVLGTKISHFRIRRQLLSMIHFHFDLKWPGRRERWKYLVENIKLTETDLSGQSS